MAEKFRYAQSVINAYQSTLLLVALLCAGGVAVWGDDVKLGRFMLIAVPTVSGMVVLSRMEKRREESKAETRDLNAKVDTIVTQTNGKTIEQVRQAERDQLVNDDAFLDRLADRLIEKLDARTKGQATNFTG